MSSPLSPQSLSSLTSELIRMLGMTPPGPGAGGGGGGGTAPAHTQAGETTTDEDEADLG